MKVNWNLVVDVVVALVGVYVLMNGIWIEKYRKDKQPFGNAGGIKEM